MVVIVKNIIILTAKSHFIKESCLPASSCGYRTNSTDWFLDSIDIGQEPIGQEPIGDMMSVSDYINRKTKIAGMLQFQHVLPGLHLAKAKAAATATATA